jgi:hypothetical protein
VVPGKHRPPRSAESSVERLGWLKYGTWTDGERRSAPLTVTRGDDRDENYRVVQE